MNTVPFPDLPIATPPPDPESWVERHGDYLFNYAVGQLRDATAAEDLVQDTLVAALRTQDRFARRSSERTWLTGILRHKILDHFRQQQRRPTVPLVTEGDGGSGGLSDDTLLWLHEVADECASPSRRLELAEFHDALVQAMGTLPPRIAQVFELHALQDLPSETVCEEMKISPENLWVMLHRARKQLRSVLESMWEGTETEAVPLRV
ncbi:MAG TPA: sigma-70 family RNA polymerase sigma factor [Verrucomicrobiota bacterium]|nr:sigma-70 family RNA polymerase sigma factor [Verrucomicrobiota bacterium]